MGHAGVFGDAHDGQAPPAEAAQMRGRDGEQAGVDGGFWRGTEHGERWRSCPILTGCATGALARRRKI
jgi:hypothetical protein